MLAVLDHTADLPTAERSITPTSAGPAPFTEQQALADLKSYDVQSRPPVRTFATAWGWSKSRVDRFLRANGQLVNMSKDWIAERDYQRDNVGQSRDNDADVRSHEQLRTLLINGAKDFDRHFPEPTAEQAADEFIAKRMLPERPIATAANPKAGADDDDQFDWSPESPDLVAPAQRALAVYVNAFNQLVIREEAAEYGDEDRCIVVDRAHVPTLVAKITAVAESR